MDVTEGMNSPAFVALVRSRDPAALNSLANAYLAQILRTARGAGFSPEQAEDLAQSTFATFIETAPRFASAGKLIANRLCGTPSLRERILLHENRSRRFATGL